MDESQKQMALTPVFAGYRQAYSDSVYSGARIKMSKLAAQIPSRNGDTAEAVKGYV